VRRHRRGDFAAGTLPPSESRLSLDYGVSRITVRATVAALRAEGLIDVADGKGNFVRAPPAAAADLPRRHRDHHRPPPRPGRARACARYAPATADKAALLAVEPDTELIVREIRATATRLAADITTSYLPATLANDTRLAEPDLAIAQLDGVLADLGHPLALTERVTARMPTPDERDTFDLLEGVPLLRATRITTDTRDDTPPEARVTLLPAEGVELEYHPTPTGQLA
jgi:GntR family transcriptional regulator